MDEAKNDATCTHSDAAHQIENISSNNRNAREGFSNHCDALIYGIGSDLCGLDKKIQDTAIELATYVESISTFKHKIIIPESTASILKNWLQVRQSKLYISVIDLNTLTFKQFMYIMS